MRLEELYMYWNDCYVVYYRGYLSRTGTFRRTHFFACDRGEFPLRRIATEIIDRVPNVVLLLVTTTDTYVLVHLRTTWCRHPQHQKWPTNLTTKKK